MTEAFIVSAVRTPVGKRGGSLSGAHPADLAAHSIRAAVHGSGAPTEAFDDVILGCVSQVGAQSTNIARTAALGAGLPEHVPGVTVDRQCGSSQQAVTFAAQAIRSGDADLIVAGGVEVMSLITIGSSARIGMDVGMGHPRGGSTWSSRYGDQEISQFRGAELIAEDYAISREEMESFAVESHQRAAAASSRGLFADEIVPYDEFAVDETFRPEPDLDRMRTLEPLVGGGRLTAATSSSISDGSSALVIASTAAVEAHGLKPLARIHTSAVIGSDPVRMLTGPIPATRRVLERAGLTISDIDAFEVNEAFASVALAWMRELDVERERTNPNGGAIALGHPLGATGARLMTTLVHHLRRNDLRYGLQTMCEGGGVSNATIIEALA